MTAVCCSFARPCMLSCHFVFDTIYRFGITSSFHFLGVITPHHTLVYYTSICVTCTYVEDSPLHITRCQIFADRSGPWLPFHLHDSGVKRHTTLEPDAELSAHIDARSIIIAFWGGLFISKSCGKYRSCPLLDTFEVSLGV